MKIRLLLPLLLVSAALSAPASANWFHNPYQNINRNVGSAPNPTPADLREMRLPIAVKNEQVDPAATAANTAAEPSPSATPAPAAAAPVPTETVAAAQPAR